MTTQSNVQGLLEGGVGLQNTAQSGVPSGVNNGNPNTPYNWATYIPSIINGANGQPTNVSFNPLTATVPNMSAYGNQTPFTPDPFMAMLLSQLRAPSPNGLGGVPSYGGGGNSMINNILANMLRGPTGSAPTMPGPGGTAPPSGGGTAPVGGTGIPVVGTPPANTGGGRGPSINYDSWGVAPISSGYNNSSPGYGSYPGLGSSLSSTFGYDISGSPTAGSANTNFSQNPVGSGYDFSTSPLTGSGSSPSNGNFFTRLADSLGLVPANASPGGFWSDMLASGAQSLGINGTMDPNTPNTFNPLQAAAGLIGGPAGSAAYNAIMGPAAGATPANGNLGGIVTTGPDRGFGFPSDGASQGSWNFNDTYQAPNYDFSNLATSLPTGGDPNFDIDAWLANAPASYQGDGTAAPTTRPSAGTGTGAGVVTVANPYGSYRTSDETAAQRDARYATEAAAVSMRDSQNEAINAAELRAAMIGRRQ